MPSSSGSSKPWGVLLMAYGAPESVADIERFYTSIRRGRAPSPEQLAELLRRYEAIGGVTPLREVTARQAYAVEGALRAEGLDARVFLGTRHGRPTIGEAMRAMAAAGIERAVGLVLAPHYSRMSIGQYVEAARKEQEQVRPGMELRFVERWGANPAFVADLAQRVGAALDGWDADRTEVVFTAHSLPERIRSWDDPYERELAETAGLAAQAARLRHWSLAYQSASPTGEPWLGPNLTEHLAGIASARARSHVLVCPIGFVADNLEILYDLDIEATAHCRRLGLDYRRTPMQNASAELIAAAVLEIREAMGEPTE